jgi:hypothetical protein
VKIAACLGVKDEIELIGPALAHLRAIGVGHVIASDAGSRDGTAEFLAHAAGPTLDAWNFDDRNTAPDHEARETARIVARAREVGADWLIFVDADEFPLPRSGSLQDVAGLATADVLVIHRFNVPLRADGPAIALPPDPRALDDVLLYAPDTSRQATQARVRQDPTAPWIGVIPAPKVMIRTARIDTTAEGNHNAVARDGGPTLRLVPDDLVTAHVPFTTEGRFARKIANIAALVADTGHSWGPDTGWHWRRWLDNVAERGGVAGEMARNLVTAEELAELRRTGIVRTATEVLDRGQADRAEAR